MLRFALIAGWFLFAILGSADGLAQPPYRVLPQDFNQDKTQQMMRAYLRNQVHAALDQRLAELETALESDAGVAAYQVQRREILSSILGPMPPRTDLAAQVVGVITQDGYQIEKILFESQPGFFVTGNLYRPSGDGPFPAILHPVGHSENGKAYDAYQRANALLAKHGFIVLCFDPIGQGERKQLIDKQGNALRRGSGEHQELGAAPILLGRSLASYMLWDGVRAIDYLGSRRDVDANRIGCTGNSGGGNMTSYLMAYDERIVAAAPGCFMTTHRRKNESPGPGDAEQNLYSQISRRFDHPDFILARAPAPTLILAATKDYVPIEGTWEAFRQAKRFYTALGYPQRVDLVETNASHGFSSRLREGAVNFFARWLQDRHIDATDDPDFATLDDEILQVTPDGQVMMLSGARSIHDLFVESGQQLATQRLTLTRDVVRQVTGVRPASMLPEPRVEFCDSDASAEAEAPQRLVFHPEVGIVLPALYWPHGDGQPVLLAPGDGLNSVLAQAGQLQSQGHPVLIVEVRDTGETRTRNWRFWGADYYIAHMLGRCWLGMRCEDLLVSARWLAAQHHGASIELQSSGEAGSAAMHARFLQPELIDSLQIENSLTSWQSLFRSTDTHRHLHQAVQGAFRHYDLPDLESGLE